MISRIKKIFYIVFCIAFVLFTIYDVFDFSRWLFSSFRSVFDSSFDILSIWIFSSIPAIINICLIIFIRKYKKRLLLFELVISSSLCAISLLIYLFNPNTLICLIILKIATIFTISFVLSYLFVLIPRNGVKGWKKAKMRR